MMKTSRKPLLAVILLLSIAGCSLVAYSYIFVSSNVVHVDMQYTVVLSTVSVVNSSITLSAAVTNDGNPAGAGITVDFYRSFDGGDWTYFATQFTDAGGVAQTTYTAGYIGGYDFRAVVTIP